MEDEATQRSTQSQSQAHVDDSHILDDDIACILLCTTNNVRSPLELKLKNSGGQQEWKFGRNPTCDFQLSESKRLSNCHFVIWSVSDCNIFSDVKICSNVETYLLMI